MERLNPYLKAIVGAAVAAVTALLLVIQGAESFSDVTVAEWLTVALSVLGTAGAVYVVPNKSA